MERSLHRDILPTLLAHAAAGLLHVGAALKLSAGYGSAYLVALAVLLLVGPVGGALLSRAGQDRAGAGLLLASFVGTAALVLYGHLGLGGLLTGLQAPAGSLWKITYLLTAAMLPMLQIKGILEALPTVLPPEAEEQTAA